MTVSFALRNGEARRYFEWAVDALRRIGWPQVRGATLFGLAAWALASLINLHPLLQFLETLPADLLLLGYAIDYQIKAFFLLAAIVIANRAVDEGASKRLSYVAAAIVGCAVGVVVGELFSSTWRAFVLPDRWPATRPWIKGPGAPFYYLVWGLTHWLLVGGCAVFFYADRRAARITEGWRRCRATAGRRPRPASSARPRSSASQAGHTRPRQGRRSLAEAAR